MAESDLRQPTETVQEEGTNKLKHLDFIQVAALYVIVYLVAIYEYAKENCGPLKSGVYSVESTVKTVTEPVIQKFHDAPFKFLKFFDDEIDVVIRDLNRLTPSLLKQVANKVMSAAQKAPEVAREVQQDGVMNMARNMGNNLYSEYEPKVKEIYNECEPKVKELYGKYEPKVVDFLVWVWRLLNLLPFFLQLAQIIAPTVRHWCEKYNESLVYAREKGYMGSQYLPLIHLEKIAKTFEGGCEKVPSSTSDGESRFVSNDHQD